MVSHFFEHRNFFRIVWKWTSFSFWNLNLNRWNGLCNVFRYCLGASETYDRKIEKLFTNFDLFVSSWYLSMFQFVDIFIQSPFSDLIDRSFPNVRFIGSMTSSVLAFPCKFIHSIMVFWKSNGAEPKIFCIVNLKEYNLQRDGIRIYQDRMASHVCS